MVGEISTETCKELQYSFPLQTAAFLKVNGSSHSQIIKSLQNTFDKTYSISTVDHWFAAGGTLEPYVAEIKEKSANETVREATTLLKLATKRAAIVLTELLDSKNDRIRLMAAKIILNTFLSDRKSYKYEVREEEIPAELLVTGDEIINNN